jgi:hypothetical protein
MLAEISESAKLFYKITDYIMLSNGVLMVFAGFYFRNKNKFANDEKMAAKMRKLSKMSLVLGALMTVWGIVECLGYLDKSGRVGPRPTVSRIWRCFQGNGGSRTHPT